MDQYAVFGNPIQQSKSPLIHQAFARQTEQRLEYKAILAHTEGFAEALEAFFQQPLAKGCNVTLPFKQQAAKWVNRLSPAAAVAGAVNTIIRQQDGTYLGDNTDGYGLVLDLQHQGLVLQNSRILLIGAGGAARGVLAPLLALAPELLVITNRTAEKATALANQANSPKVLGCGFHQLPDLVLDRPFDLVINSTSASLDNRLPQIDDEVLAGSNAVYDMVYGVRPTVFLQHVRHLGVIKMMDGLGMLVGQAAQSFYLWRGVRPEMEPVLNQLRATL